MASLEDLKAGAQVQGILPNQAVTVIDVKWHGAHAVELFYKRADGDPGTRLVYRDDEPTLEIARAGRVWSFHGDGALFRLASEAYRIHLAHLFDPMLAVHTSLIEPLPHQITAVYSEMLPRQPLRFLLADDPGAGKTIMAGLLVKELAVRGDVQRCLVCAPGSLVTQWQDELYQKFQLPFGILTHDMIEASHSGNPFLENDLLIVRLDQVSRSDDLKEKLRVTDWDLVICDEAHKMSAHFFSGEIEETKRYKLGKLLGGVARHFLLMTATPHNGKEEDFQLFLALLDADRFEGRFRDGVHTVDVSDLMRRMVKEKLLKFNGKPLFPERRAYTIDYALSDGEAKLYRAVTEYVREEFNRADRLESGSHRGTVGFALTVLQRRLASSPAAIHESLRRRRERLEDRLREEKLLKRGIDLAAASPVLSEEDIEDLDDAPSDEVEAAEETVVDGATAARTVAELEAEIATLKRLEREAYAVRRSGVDRKWEELSGLMHANKEMVGPQGERRKLVIFTEHRDTLAYLVERIGTLLGRPDAIVTIRGGMSREERRVAEDRFRNDPGAVVLVATDAAGEGINLQRAHLMVNYDLPWNPNRLEQRFGRIHRIGQTEVCHLWNLVAGETREGAVYRRLLQKLKTERDALDGKVFNVLGRLFEGEPLRRMLMKAVRYGNQPDVRARLEQAIDNATDQEHVREMLEADSLATEAMDITEIMRVRGDMERAAARRLQPHYIKSFFIQAFEHLGGSIREREPGRCQITHVPALIRQRDRQIGVGAPVGRQYERVCFEKPLISVPGKPLAEFVCPGHPLLDSVIDLVLERYRGLLRDGAVLVDQADPGEDVRALFYLEQRIQDARATRSGEQRTISREVHFVEIGAGGEVRSAGAAPYLDYRPAAKEEIDALAPHLAADWLAGEDLEQRAAGHAIADLVPRHLKRVRERREALIDKTLAAVHERLTKEINYWDHRAVQLREQERAGKRNVKINAQRAQQRADDLAARLKQRTAELEQERQISAAPPVVVGGAIVVPAGLIYREIAGDRIDRRITEQIAMQAVMQAEVVLGNAPEDVSKREPYDILSRAPGGKQRFIEVKGRIEGADNIELSRNELLTARNAPEQYIVAIVEIEEDSTPNPPRYIFDFAARFDVKDIGFAETGRSYNIRKLLEQSEEPR